MSRLLKLVVLSWLLLQISACATTGSVEDADLFSIGNIPRWEAEQKEREAKNELLEREIFALEREVSDREKHRKELREKENRLKNSLADQESEILSLERLIQSALDDKKIVESEHETLKSRLNVLLIRIRHLTSVSDYSEREMKGAINTNKEAEKTINEITERFSIDFKTKKEIPRNYNDGFIESLD